MKRFHNLLAVFAMALASCFTYCWRTVEDAAVQVRGFYRAAKARATQITLVGLELAHQPQLVLRPAVMLQRARALRQRQERRDRPVIESTWRMCPSG